MSLLWKKLNTIETGGKLEKEDPAHSLPQVRVEKPLPPSPHVESLTHLFQNYFFFQYESLTGKYASRESLKSDATAKPFLEEFDSIHAGEIDRLAKMKEVIHAESISKSPNEVWTDVYRYIRILSFYVKHYALNDRLGFELLNLLQRIQFYSKSSEELSKEARRHIQVILGKWVFTDKASNALHPMIYDEYLFLSGGFSEKTIYTELFDSSFIGRQEAILTLSGHYEKSEDEIQSVLTKVRGEEAQFSNLLQSLPDKLLRAADFLK